MTDLSPVFKRALGAVWTAGYRPGIDLKFALQRRCGWFDVAKAYSGGSFASVEEYIQAEAIRALRETGYPIADDPRGLDLVKPMPVLPHLDAPPQPGDLIRCLSPWNGCEVVGLQGVIGCDRRGFTIANREGRWSVGTSPDRVNCVSMGNGGPASIGYLDARKLRSTGETDRLFAWEFALNPSAHTGVDFWLPVRVWEWSGDESDFIDWQEAEEPFEPVETVADCVDCHERLTLEERDAGDQCESCVNARLEP